MSSVVSNFCSANYRILASQYDKPINELKAKLEREGKLSKLELDELNSLESKKDYYLKLADNWRL